MEKEATGERILVIGSGAREHALCWKLSRSDDISIIYASPGNVGTAAVAKVQNVEMSLDNFGELTQWCKTRKINLVVVGPEAPLAAGLADALAEGGILCFGPGKAAAQIEASKEWAKDFMIRHDIPTARYGTFRSAQEAKNFIQKSSYPALVVKASGLAAGKGVIVAGNREEAFEAVDEILTKRKFGEAGEVLVVEELLEGEEISYMAFTDGHTLVPMLPAQDYKRLLDGDKGPNTGGMGAYCPCPLLTPTLEELCSDILRKVVNGLKQEGITYTGVIYAGIMITKYGPKVLEFNSRFGDPEAQVILPLLENDLYEIMKACCTEKLHEQRISWRENSMAVGIVMASSGYPHASGKGSAITGLDQAHQLVFHSGTSMNGNELIVNGGRVLTVVATAFHLSSAVAKARRDCEVINFEGAHFRRDIACNGIARSLLVGGQLTYKGSGVDIDKGGVFVSKIKSVAEETVRPGCLGSVGGFGGFFDLQALGYRDPILVSGADGVGTKLKVARECQIHSTIGIDLVAMCVNDILTHGAEPLYFLDYFASGELDPKIAGEVVKGIAEGCKTANCALIGGETAEMPGSYPFKEYDLAGFAVGAAEREMLLPKTDRIVPGDVVIGIASNGIHSNGFSLVRKVMENAGFRYNQKAPFGHKSLGEEFLTPTKIYSGSILPALKSGKVKAAAHITGGGLIGNIPRILPPGVRVRLDASAWEILPVFAWLAMLGGIKEEELLKTFNCGIGMVLIVAPQDTTAVLSSIQGEKTNIIGHVESCGSVEERVIVENFVERMDQEMRRYIPHLVEKGSKKRVGALISGSGTNLQALIDFGMEPSCSYEIVLVLSNKSNVEGLRRAERANIPTAIVKHTDFPNRVVFDMEVHKILLEAKVDIVCLAGFMRILSPEFVGLWKGKMINIHPSLLPSFKGMYPHRQALDAGVRVSGCTVHFVEAALDAGDIICQESVIVELDDTEDTLEERVKTVEHKAFPKALELLASGKVSLDASGKIAWKST